MSNQFLSEAELHAALEEGRICLLYRPQFAARDRVLVGAEALARNHAHDGSLLLPQQFNSVMEASTLVGEIGLLLFETACRAASSWHGATTAINVSRLQFRE